MTISAVAFDLDGTLYSDRSVYIRSVPLFLRHPRFIAAFNRMRKDIRKLPRIDDLRLKQAEMVASELRIPVGAASDLIERIIYGEWERYYDRIRPFPHVREMLDRLKRDGLKLVLLSDFPVEAKLRFLQLENVWDYRVSSDTAHHLKPHPAPFTLIRDAIGEPFERILYVGDRYRYDIVGAKGVGMLAAHFTRKKIKSSIADITFSDYGELYEILAKKFI
jgi:putative hydrolase of the HAD superfamily